MQYGFIGQTSWLVPALMVLQACARATCSNRRTALEFGGAADREGGLRLNARTCANLI